MWFRGMLSARFDIKTNVLGSGTGEAREGKVLNGVLRVSDDGWRYEADQRHAEILVEGLGLEAASPVGTPGEEEKGWETEANEEKLGPEEARCFRALAARANYLALDRADIQFAVKEICQSMSSPCEGDWGKHENAR